MEEILCNGKLAEIDIQLEVHSEKPLLPLNVCIAVSECISFCPLYFVAYPTWGRRKLP